VKLVKSGGRTVPGPAEWFTGTVFIDGVQSPGDDGNLSCAHVRFAPGARTAWHTHPEGQTLYVTDGIGYVASRGGEVREIRPGDVVFIAPVRSTGTALPPSASCRTSPSTKPMRMARS
jgi:quercetin dioxygenase-like cupin family protein